MKLNNLRLAKLVLLVMCLMWGTGLHAQCTKNGSVVDLAGDWNYTNYTRTYDDDLIIDAGYTVTFNYSTIQFKKGAHIIVQPGATLVLIHTTVTTACAGTMWGGIIVKEKSGSNGGWCSVDTSIIEWADTGVVARSGGVVNSMSATFSNCHVGVALRPYVDASRLLATNQSIFLNSKFICTDTLPGYGYKGRYYHSGGGTFVFMDLDSVKNVVIAGDSFINTVDQNNLCYDSSLNLKNRGIGIQSVNSSFVVYPSFVPYYNIGGQYGYWLLYDANGQLQSWYCDVDGNSKPSYFYNLAMGIKHASIYPQYNANIIGANFLDCTNAAIQCMGDYYTTIRKCNIKMDGSTGDPYGYDRAGIRLISSRRFVVDSNTLVIDSAGPSGIGVAMFSLSNSTKGGGTIYNNRFIRINRHDVLSSLIFGMRIGGDVFGDVNETSDMNPKVTFTCNTFNGFENDILIKAKAIGLVQDQGSASLDAANTFSTCVSGHKRIAPDLNMKYYTDTADPAKYGSSCSDSHVTYINVNNNNSCTPSTCLGTPRL